jgi:hypothetical protein
MLMVALAVPVAWAWNFSRRMLAATDEAQRGRLKHRFPATPGLPPSPS